MTAAANTTTTSVSPISDPTSLYASVQYPLKESETVGNWMHFKRMKYSRAGIRNNSVLVPAEGASTIVLPLPPQLAQGYRTEWEMTDLGIKGEERLEQLGKGFQSLLNVYDKGTFSEQDAWDTGSAAWKGVKSLVTAVAIDAATDNALFNDAAMGFGVARNPYKAMYFKTPNFRVFNFEYKLMPRNMQEAQAIRSIIREFKVGMAPSFNNGLGENNLYNYPDLFDISITKNEYLFKIVPCILNDFQINYHAEGTPFYLDDGTGVKVPGSLTITMAFQETRILTREDFAEDIM